MSDLQTELNCEEIYYKLRLLANISDHMGSDKHYHAFGDGDHFAMYLLLMDIAKEVYPAWRALHKDPEQDAE